MFKNLFLVTCFLEMALLQCYLNEGEQGPVGTYPYLLGTATHSCTIWSIATEFSASTVLVTGSCSGAPNYGVLFEMDGAAMSTEL